MVLPRRQLFKMDDKHNYDVLSSYKAGVRRVVGWRATVVRTSANTRADTGVETAVEEAHAGSGVGEDMDQGSLARGMPCEGEEATRESACEVAAAPAAEASDVNAASVFLQLGKFLGKCIECHQLCSVTLSPRLCNQLVCELRKVARAASQTRRSLSPPSQHKVDQPAGGTGTAAAGMLVTAHAHAEPAALPVAAAPSVAPVASHDGTCSPADGSNDSSSKFPPHATTHSTTAALAPRPAGAVLTESHAPTLSRVSADLSSEISSRAISPETVSVSHEPPTLRASPLHGAIRAGGARQEAASSTSYDLRALMRLRYAHANACSPAPLAHRSPAAPPPLHHSARWLTHT